VTLLSIAEHAKKYGIAPLKKYGQNFIFDLTLCEKIVRASEMHPGDTVLEVGPGTAGLTRAILSNSPKSLTVIETDQRMIPLLDDIKNLYPNLHIVKDDALKYDIEGLPPKIRIISNLPYNVGTPLIIKWLKSASKIENITVMLQKEVVDRMRAEVSTKSYGRLSVICRLVCDTQKCFDVSPKAFYPPPKVDSSVVKLTPKAKQPSTQLLSLVETITNQAFSQRRKMIKSSLSKISDISSILMNLGIKDTERAENITPEQYLEIALSCLQD
jgi:16S rRNA (adenine1518-N6/adenine1519-N6)-dimethyltransferase